jgi:hypothetical protein
MNIRRIVRNTAIAGVLGLSLAACGTGYTTEADEVAVHVNSYAMVRTDKTVSPDCVSTNTSGWNGWNDEYYYYPAGQRSYTFSDAKGADGPPITVVKNGVPLTIRGTIFFYLNEDCGQLNAFHSKLGIKQWEGGTAYVRGPNKDEENQDGWTGMLDVVVYQPLSATLVSAANGSKATVDDLYAGVNNDDFKLAIEKGMPTSVKALTGGDYFKNFTVSLEKPTAPEDYVAAQAAGTVAQKEKANQALRNETAAKQYETFAECKKYLSEPGCVAVYGINSGRVTVVPIPQGGSVAVQAQPPAAK